MKKLFSLATLLTFLVIAFFQNPMMSFAMQRVDDMETKMSMRDDCCSGNENSKQECKHKCCYESTLLFL